MSKPFTFDQWWFDHRIKFGIKAGGPHEVVAMAAWQAALENAPLPEAADTSRYKEALKHILWIKECGVDGTDKNGKFRNFPETERDGMYKIAKDALEPQPSEKSE